MALDTVADYVTAARVLLQDKIAPYRYADADLVAALSFSMLEARKLRVDLFIGRDATIPSYTANDATAVVMDNQYRTALVYFVVGYTQLQDDEDTQDSRAGAFLGKFKSQMSTGS